MPAKLADRRRSEGYSSEDVGAHFGDVADEFSLRNVDVWGSGLRYQINGREGKCGEERAEKREAFCHGRLGFWSSAALIE